jgi:hypothetical protein
MKHEYKTVDITTLKGLRYAELLKMCGWTIIITSPITITFERK